MSSMEEIYVVKVKTKPETSQLYPSERRYSASTVGGLGLVHLLLGATTLLLVALGVGAEEAAAGKYGGGIALGLAACGAAVVAILAWRRWYIDHNIRHFLVASAIAGVVSVVCLIVTAVALATVQEELSQQHLAHGSHGRHNPAFVDASSETTVVTNNPTYFNNMPEGTLIDRPAFTQNDSDAADKTTEETIVILNPIYAGTEDTVVHLNPTYDSNNYEKPREVTPIVVSATEKPTYDSNNYEKPREVTPIDVSATEKPAETLQVVVEEANVTEVNDNVGGNITAEARVGDVPPQVDLREMRNVLLINILIASVLECAWCGLSMRIAWRGMVNDEDTVQKTKKMMTTKRFVEGADKKVTALPPMRGKRRPDIIANHMTSLQNKYLSSGIVANGVGNDMEHYLPKEESHVEYEERVRKFLASNNEGQ